jgi:formylglycine-generating enzyme required for sulfatase activity
MVRVGSLGVWSSPAWRGVSVMAYLGLVLFASCDADPSGTQGTDAVVRVDVADAAFDGALESDADVETCADDEGCADEAVCIEGSCERWCAEDDDCAGTDSRCDTARGFCVGSEVGPACEQGAFGCDDDVTAWVCDDGTLTRSLLPCRAEQRCVEGVCIREATETTCAPNSIGCDDASTAWVCSPDGRTRSRLPCLSSQRCEEGVCVLGRVDPVCAPGAVGCEDDDTRWVCSASGDQRSTEPCPSGTRCDAGDCVPEGIGACTEGERRCRGDEAQRCDASGEWASVETCGAAERCEDGACRSIEVPSLPTPTGVRATDGSRVDAVEVTWNPVVGAVGYIVARDDVPLNTVPMAGTRYVDAGARPGRLPTGALDVSAIPRDSGTVSVTWSSAPAAGTSGPDEVYRVRAVALSGVRSELSASDTGYRGAPRLERYRWRVDGGAWQGAGSATEAIDSAVPDTVVRVEDVQASDGSLLDRVALSARVVTERPPRRYEVEAVYDGGDVGPAGSALALFSSPSVALQWQRSAGDADADYTDLAGATTAVAEDATAPATGQGRWYRLRATVGSTIVTSSADRGFRARPAATVALGDPCTNDLECGADAWCSTGSEPRRCAPEALQGTPDALRMVWVPSGTFVQGTPGATDQERAWDATLRRSWFMGRTEVTRGQWKALTGGVAPNDILACGDDCPVHNVSWYAAVAFTNALSEAEGLPACYTLAGCTDPDAGWHNGNHQGCTGATFTGLSCAGYRLPTESEWERAARGGTTSTWFWGESSDRTAVAPFAWYRDSSGGRTRHRVAQLAPNPYGLYDTAGNVLEWVWDRHSLTYPVGAADDYLGPVSGDSRVFRGGHSLSTADFIRSARRGFVVPTEWESGIGFRVARSTP